MVAIRRILREPEVVWRTANPMWREYLNTDVQDERDKLRVPFLARFNSDSFIEDFLDILAVSPSRLREWEARKETWRLPLPPVSVSAPKPNWQAPDEPSELSSEPLKLYQPVQERYYLVTASLVCRIPGMPDKMLDNTAGERASFVVRRYMPSADTGALVEHAQINGIWTEIPAGREREIQRNETQAPEEQYPLFPACYTDDVTRTQRRVFAGLVPVSQREKFFTAGKRANLALPSGESAEPLSTVEQLMTLFDVDVLSPWRQLLREVEYDPNDGQGLTFRAIDETNFNDGDFDEDDIEDIVSLAYDLIEIGTWYTLLDFANFLERYLPSVMAKIRTSSVSLSGVNLALYNLLNTTTFKATTVSLANADTKSEFKAILQGGTGAEVSLVAALKTADQNRATLESGDGNYPSDNFLLTGTDVRALTHDTTSTEADEPRIDQSPIAVAMRDALQAAYGSNQASPRIPLLPAAAAISQSARRSDYTNRDSLFIIRCVFERPHCPPGVRPEVVSEPTQEFTMAPFFDPDAPSRPIRIPMPIDTTPSGLRKFAKNTMFVMSDTLACQVEAARKITFADLVLSVLPWPFHKDLPSTGAGDCKPGVGIGMICTLSIPIITIVALILLIIMVLLLNSIFFWIPFLIFCLPLPVINSKD